MVHKRINRRFSIGIILIIFIYCFITSAQTNPHINRYFDKPLFNYNVIHNKIPYGNYMMIRSTRKVSQIFISKNWSKIFLFTDRNNIKVSPITASAYERLKMRKLNNIKMRQSIFFEKIESILVKGDSHELTNYPFPGLELFHENLKNGKATIKKYGYSYIVTMKNNDSTFYDTAQLTLDIVRNNCIIMRRGIQKIDLYDDLKYPIYIVQTYDTRIKKLLRFYSLKFKKYYNGA